jgi:hypothetical protein
MNNSKGVSNSVLLAASLIGWGTPPIGDIGQ